MQMQMTVSSSKETLSATALVQTTAMVALLSSRSQKDRD